MEKCRVHRSAESKANSDSNSSPSSLSLISSSTYFFSSAASHKESSFPSTARLLKLPPYSLFYLLYTLLLVYSILQTIAMDTDFSINVMASYPAKGNRSKRLRPCFSAEEEELPPWSSCSDYSHDSKDEEMAAHSLMLISHDLSSSGASRFPSPTKRVMKKPKDLKSHSADSPYEKPSYKCKTCSKAFLSFQALGGHRASCCHNTNLAHHTTAESEKTSNSNNKMKVHECPICRRVFSSGQALGGHKRTHSTPPPPPPEEKYEERAELDLNMPAPLDDLYTHDSSAVPVVKPHYKDYKMSPPFWWMPSSGKRVPSVYNGNIADEAQNEVLLGRDLGLKQYLFKVATVN